MKAFEAESEPMVSYLKDDDTLLSVSLLAGSDPEDKRMPLLPNHVEALIAMGFRVLVETREGVDDFDLMSTYAVAGAYLCRSRRELMRSKIILSVEMLESTDVLLMGSHQVLVSYLDFSRIDSYYLDILVLRGISAVSYDYVVDNELAWNLPRSSEELLAHSVLFKTLEYFRYACGRLISSAQGLQPFKACLIGNTYLIPFMAGLLRALGAEVKVFDPDLKMPAMELEEALINTDLVLTHYHCFGNKGAIILSCEQVLKMPQGSLLVDINCGQQRCVESFDQECGFFMFDHVAHYAVVDESKAFYHSCSALLSEVNYYWLKQLYLSNDIGTIIHDCEGFRSGLYTHDHQLCNLELSVRFQRPYTHIDPNFH